MKIMKNTQYRQGDVLIEMVREIPDSAQKQAKSQRLILAHGEVTGHRHCLVTTDPVDWWKHDEFSTTIGTSTTLPGGLFLALSTCAKVTHPEHATLEIPPGQYRVSRQREYSPAGPQPVVA